MGRSHGGLTTQIDALLDASGRPIRLKLPKGKDHDSRSGADMVGAIGADPATDQQTKDHRMVVTYVKYVGAPPDVASTTANFALANGQGWGDAAPRAWFARAFWPALQTALGTATLP